jgi:hypothetical protein
MTTAPYIPLPKNPITWILAVIHILWILGFMWIGVLFTPQKYRWIWILLMVAEFVHWHFSKGECMLSYYEKRYEDPRYKLGDNPELTYAWVILGHITNMSMKELRMLHAQITQIMFIFAVADQVLVYNIFNVEYTIRMILFLYFLYFVITFVSFDSFQLLANDLKN